MPTHLYGQLADYGQTRRLVEERGWFILENDSLAATISSNRQIRAFGDALLLSFGSGKTIDAGGGGAVLTNDPGLASALSRRSRQWPVFDDAGEAAETNLVLARRYLRALGGEALIESMLNIDVAYSRHTLNDLHRGRIAAGLDEFFAENQERNRRLARWHTALRHLSELASPTISMPTPWRAVFFFKRPRLRNLVVDALRKTGFDAGTNYPPLSDFFPTLLQDQTHPDADAWGQTVLTLWLDRSYDDARISEAAALIENICNTDAKARSI